MWYLNYICVAAKWPQEVIAVIQIPGAHRQFLDVEIELCSRCSPSSRIVALSIELLRRSGAFLNLGVKK